MKNANKKHHQVLKKPYTQLLISASLMFIVVISGCASVPPQIAKTHQKELEILKSLQSSHLAMIDAYVDQKLQNFENFFFKTYGPVYLNHWIE